MIIYNVFFGFLYNKNWKNVPSETCFKNVILRRIFFFIEKIILLNLMLQN